MAHPRLCLAWRQRQLSEKNQIGRIASWLQIYMRCQLPRSTLTRTQEIVVMQVYQAGEKILAVEHKNALHIYMIVSFKFQKYDSTMNRLDIYSR